MKAAPGHRPARGAPEPGRAQRSPPASPVPSSSAALLPSGRAGVETHPRAPTAPPHNRRQRLPAATGPRYPPGSTRRAHPRAREAARARPPHPPTEREPGAHFPPFPRTSPGPAPLFPSKDGKTRQPLALPPAHPSALASAAAHARCLPRPGVAAGDVRLREARREAGRGGRWGAAGAAGPQWVTLRPEVSAILSGCSKGMRVPPGRALGSRTVISPQTGTGGSSGKPLRPGTGPAQASLRSPHRPCVWRATGSSQAPHEPSRCSIYANF